MSRLSCSTTGGEDERWGAAAPAAASGIEGTGCVGGERVTATFLYKLLYNTIEYYIILYITKYYNIILHYIT